MVTNSKQNYITYASACSRQHSKWVRCFNDGRESIENDPRVGRPVSVLTEKNVATVKTLIEEDARYTRDRRIKWHSFVKCFEDLT